MEVKPGNSGQVRAPHQLRRHTQTGAGRAGIVKGRMARGKFGIDAQAALQFPGQEAGMRRHLLPEAVPLGQAVEIKVVGNLRQFRNLLRGVRGRIGQHMLAEPAPGQKGLPQSGRAAAVQQGAQVLKTGPGGKPLQSQHDPAPRGIRYLPEDAGVAFQCWLADDKGGHEATTT